MTSMLDSIEMAFTHVRNHNQTTRKCSLCSFTLQHKLALRKGYVVTQQRQSNRVFTVM
jgi:hypothetical protein